MRNSVLPLMVFMLVSGPAFADENSDLNLIPQGLPPVAKAAPAVSGETAGGGATSGTGGRGRIYVENALTLVSRRDGLAVATPPPDAPRWQERLFLDVRREWSLGDSLTFNLSNRVAVRSEEGLGGTDRRNVLNDFREGYLSWAVGEGTYLEAGRINQKNGVALGFNPTDFFKSRAVIAPITVDPNELREDRLGAAMLRAQHLWTGGAVTALYAPKLTNESAIRDSRHLRGFNPSFDHTNAEDRFLIKATAAVFDDVSPELLVYRAGGRTLFGANLTESIGSNVVVYGEWAGGRQTSLIDAALRYGKRTGTFPVNMPSVMTDDPGARFMHAVSLGASYATADKMTINLEYHFYEPGLQRHDWQRWFAAGKGQSPTSPLVRQLWYLRGYAQDQQQPMGMHSAFLRINQADAFVRDLELTGMIKTDLADGSSLLQLTADYHLSDLWTVGATANANVGGRKTDFGSLQREAGVLFKVARYF